MSAAFYVTEKSPRLKLTPSGMGINASKAPNAYMSHGQSI